MVLSFLRKLQSGAKQDIDLDRTIRDEFARTRTEAANSAKLSRDELRSLHRDLQTDMTKRLDEMRRTVDENLKDTVEKRFNDSFKLISERLEQVQRGLGEMQALATGVGDLKRVLTNVTTRGNLGEVQLGSLLAQTLAPNQFTAQVSIRDGSAQRVDFAIELPDKNENGKALLLPVDSKFPTESYSALLDAYDNADAEASKRAGAAFEAAIRLNAKTISEKYINPPVTTDFAIMFVPTEGLYAEAVRRTALFEEVQVKYRVTIVGPSNLSAFLSSLQLGFRTLAIERRSGEVWELLGAVKAEFVKYGAAMDKLTKQLNTALKEAENIGTRSRAIERKLRNVENAEETLLDTDDDSDITL
jgi:DNA recombination protein RmuC